MTLWRLVSRSVRYYARMHSVVALGVAAATAVLVGALLVGDTVRLSLVSLTEERLGRIDFLILSQDFFRADRVDRLAEPAAGAPPIERAVGLIILPQSTLEAVGRVPRHVGKVEVLATPAEFWELRADGSPAPKKLPDEFEIVVNQTLAEDLGVRVGDMVTLRLPGSESIPSDTPFGEKSELIKRLPELEVIEVLPDRGFGRFQVSPSQRTPRIAVVDPRAVREVLELDDRWNAVAVALKRHDEPPSAKTSSQLVDALQLELEDIGVHAKRVRLADPTTPSRYVYDYFSVWSDRMLMRPAVDAAVAEACGERGTPVMTYLANLIVNRRKSGAGRDVPYSLVTGIQRGPHFPLPIQPAGPSLGEASAPGGADHALSADEIVITEWLAKELDAQPGDSLEVAYYDPESPQSRLVETTAVLRVRGVAPLVRPKAPYFPGRKLIFDQRPAITNDPWLSPPVKGFSDQASIDDWDVPFPVDYSRVEAADDEYWKWYGTTPKAYISLETARLLWGSRFGQTTSWRVSTSAAPSSDALAELIEEKLDWQAVGVLAQPLRARQMTSSRGTTPFGVLFLSLSMFVIVAALLLVGLLFQLGIQQRARSVGVLAAVGFRRPRLLSWLLREELLVATGGSVLGTLIGVYYAKLMVWLLTTVWVGAISVPFLEFHATTLSILAGLVSGIVVCTLTMIWGVRGVLKQPPLSLLRGAIEQSATRSLRRRRWWVAVMACVGGAILCGWFAATSGGITQAGSFVGAGFLMLCGCLAAAWLWLHGRPLKVDPLVGDSPYWRWAARSLTRKPRRSMLTIGLIGASSFLIVSMGAFQMRPTEEGTGGFEWLGESTAPLYVDWQQTVEELFGRRLGVAGPRVFPWRLRDGDEASCTNLYRPAEPRMVGVTVEFIRAMGQRRGAKFQWGGHDDSLGRESNPWEVLLPRPSADAIPVVIDRNTAMYSLQLYQGIGEEFTLEYDGRPVRFRVAGLLADSVLQGMLLIGESDFERIFPEISGYRFFLVDAPRGIEQQVKDSLVRKFSDEGLELISTEKLLAELLAVQNTYLQTFQALGALGLLLGTFGLATVQFRNVLERKGELALLRAIGFRRGRLAGVVFRENLVLLSCGLAIGVLCALIAVLPYQWLSGNRLPLGQWLGMLAAVWLVGLVAGLFSVRAVLRLPLLSSLRNE